MLSDSQSANADIAFRLQMDERTINRLCRELSVKRSRVVALEAANCALAREASHWYRWWRASFCGLSIMVAAWLAFGLWLLMRP